MDRLNILQGSREDAWEHYGLYPYSLHKPIIICDPTERELVPEILGSPPREHLLLSFYDVVYAESRYNLIAQTKDIEEAINFALQHQELYICCRAGVSRSAALKFVLECQYLPPENAVKNLDIRKHFMNLLVVKLGSEILNKPEMIDIATKFNCEAHQWFKKKWPWIDTKSRNL